MIVTFFEDAYSHDGREAELSFDSLCVELERLLNAPPEPEKVMLTAFAPYRMHAGARRVKGADYVAAVTVGAIDVDHLPADRLAAVLDALEGWNSFVYATPSDGGPDAPERSIRVLFELSRDLTPAECAHVRMSMADYLGVQDYGVRACLEPARIFFVGRVSEEPRETWSFTGAPAPVDEVLAVATTPTTVAKKRELKDRPDHETPEEWLRELAALVSSAYSVERQTWYLPFLGWTGKYLSEADHVRLTEMLGEVNEENHFKFLNMCERVSVTEGPGPNVIRALGGAFEDVDAFLKTHPNAPRRQWETRAIRRAAQAPSAPIHVHSPESFDNFGVDMRRHICDLKTREGKEEPLISCANVVNILTTDPRWASLCYDTFAHRILVRDPPMRASDAPDHDVSGEWTDSHTARLVTWLDEQYDMRVPPTMVDMAVNTAAEKRSFHPVRAYLGSLSWDGVPRANTWLIEYLGVEDTPYTRAVGVAFLLSMVARVRQPGCKVDTVLVLEGPQGARKSSALRVLAGNDWFTDSCLDIRKKDGQEQIMGKWLVEWAELDNLARSEITAVKAFITEQVSRFRMAYGKRSKDYPRECVFAGTTNESSYLNDATGNRRFWPVTIGEIDIEKLQRDRDQLWAEVDARFAAGEPWWLDATAEIDARAEQENREAAGEDPWLPVFAEYLSRPVTKATKPTTGSMSAQFQANARNRAVEITTVVLLTEALGIPAADQNRAAVTRAGVLLRKLGWESKQKRVNGVRVRVYEFPETTEAQAAQ